MRVLRVLAFTRRVLLQFRHDKRTFGFIIVMPILLMTLFGYTFAGDVKGARVEVVSKDTGVPPDIIPPNGIKAGELVISHLDSETLSISLSEDLNASRQRVNDGMIWGAVFIPENFSKNLLLLITGANGSLPEIVIYLDGSNPTISSSILKTLNDAVLSTMKDLATRAGRQIPGHPVEIRQVYAYCGSDTRFIDYFAPGVISFAMMMITTIITILLFVNERKNGTLQRLLVSPATESEIVIGYACAFGIIGIIQSIIIICVAVLMFNITISGNIFLAVFVILLIAFGHQGLGIMLSAGAKNELQAVQFIPLIIFPSVLLTGLFWPVESIPAVLQPLSYLIPLRYAIDAERAIMLRGWGIEHIWIQILVLIGFAILTLGGSILLLKRRD